MSGTTVVISCSKKKISDRDKNLWITVMFRTKSGRVVRKSFDFLTPGPSTSTTVARRAYTSGNLNRQRQRYNERHQRQMEEDRRRQQQAQQRVIQEFWARNRAYRQRRSAEPHIPLVNNTRYVGVIANGPPPQRRGHYVNRRRVIPTYDNIVRRFQGQ